MRRRNLEMGFYFSLYEWFNPRWLAGDVDAYVKDHLFPQFKDLVTRYSPSVIFSDGEWELPSEKWRAPELLAWLFNDSAVAQHVVVNDRWGGETRHKHGGYYTTEYGAGLPGASHAWEENRGLGHSYGFNRNEDLADYASGTAVAVDSHRHGEPRRQPAAQRRSDGGWTHSRGHAGSAWRFSASG